MLRIVNRANGRSTDYSRASLAMDARHAAKLAPDSDGRCRAWLIEVSEMAGATSARLCVDYLTRSGDPRTTYVAI